MREEMREREARRGAERTEERVGGFACRPVCVHSEAAQRLARVKPSGIGPAPGGAPNLTGVSAALIAPAAPRRMLGSPRAGARPRPAPALHLGGRLQLQSCRRPHRRNPPGPRSQAEGSQSQPTVRASSRETSHERSGPNPRVPAACTASAS